MRRGPFHKVLQPVSCSGAVVSSDNTDLASLLASTVPAAMVASVSHAPSTSALLSCHAASCTTPPLSSAAMRTVTQKSSLLLRQPRLTTAVRWQTSPSTTMEDAGDDVEDEERHAGRSKRAASSSVSTSRSAVPPAASKKPAPSAKATTTTSSNSKTPTTINSSSSASAAAVTKKKTQQKAAAASGKEGSSLASMSHRTWDPVKPPPPSVAARREKTRRQLAEEAAAKHDFDFVEEKQPWRTGAAEADSVDDVAFSDSAAELFTLDEERHDAATAPHNASYNDDDVDAIPGLDAEDRSGDGEEDGAWSSSSSAVGQQQQQQQRTASQGRLNAFDASGGAPVASDIEETLVADPFHIPSVDDDALMRDGGGGGGASGSATAATAAAAHSGGLMTNPSQVSEAVLSSVDLLCDDLFHCKTDVMRSFARTKGVAYRSKAETVLLLIEKAHKDAHGENTDLSVTRQVLGDVFDESVRTSGVRTAWTNKSLEASHVEMACDRHLRFQLMSNASKTMMVRSNVLEASRVLRKLTRIFQEEQEQLSLVAVGGVFRTYRAEADELVRSLPMTEIVSPFAAYLVAYVRYGSCKTTLARQNVNDRLVQLEVFQPTIQEMDDTATLQRLMDMLDPAVRQIERTATAPRFQLKSAAALSMCVRAFSETSHTQWNTSAAPDWVHDLARLFCNWEAIVRTDLPRFADVPRHFFDCVLVGVVEYYVLQRVYGEYAVPSNVPTWVRQLLKVALTEHLSNEETATSALRELIAYVQPGMTEGATGVRGEFFVMVLSQMQGAFQDIQEERSVLHDERVAVILNAICGTASNCTRSHGLFELLVLITTDMRFHLRFQRVYKKLSAADRKTIRTKSNVKMEKTLDYFESEYHLTPISTKAVGFLVVQLLYLSLRGDGSKRPVLERFASVAGTAMLDVVGLTEISAVNVRDLRFAFPPQLSYNSWLNESDTREKSVYSVMPSVAVKGSTNQAMIVSQAPMMKALDAISRVPWRINKYMLHVQEAIVREGFGFGKIRPAFYPLHYYSLSDGGIRYPSDRRARSAAGLLSGDADGVPAEDEEADGIFNIQQRREYQLQLNADWKDLSEVRSNRIHYLQALRQARSILQFSHIYFPNSMDFRGRMYPLPGRLNHTGSDPFRGLLEYAEPKPLGTVGLYWLKVHLANKMGMSKLSFDERVHYVDEHMEDVVQSAESPLQGDRWWQEASEPLQCLMACKEVANAMKCSQGPEKFLSRLPVAVDGSYNGLQHYSAIGRDAFGASLVNLIPSERPADAYTGILKEMLKSINADAARDHQVAQRCLGTGKGQDKDHIKRKTIKRPIMTQVYGVTAFGMSEQIFDELAKQNKSHGLWTHTDMKEMAAYLRDKVLESLGVTFRETQNCRRWISEVVQLIWKVQPPELRNALCWTTPLGLVVRQPYKVRNECSLFTTSGYTKIAGDAIAPASRKQLTAIAPNLIHSLDATHLAMTALEMQHQGLSMMAVHDSYWTYACDLPKLSQVLREQFVNLYSKYDPLWELKEQWEETYFMDLRRHGVKLPEPPKRGDLDLNLVLKSPYFFS